MTPNSGEWFGVLNGWDWISTVIAGLTLAAAGIVIASVVKDYRNLR